MVKTEVKEGSSIFRLLLVWSSLSPVFIIWAVKGVNISAINDLYWICGCLICFIFPNFLIFAIFKYRKSQGSFHSIKINSVSEEKEHLITILFAMLIPFFSTNANSYREILAIFIAFAMVIMLFWHLKLHYVNLIFALFGYRILKVSVRSGTYSLEESEDNLVDYFVLSKQSHFKSNEYIKGVSLSGRVLIH